LDFFFYFKKLKRSNIRFFHKDNAYQKRKSLDSGRQDPKELNYESKVDKNKQVIGIEISRGSDVIFKYKDRKGTITNRRVTHKKIFMHYLRER